LFFGTYRTIRGNYKDFENIYISLGFQTNVQGNDELMMTISNEKFAIRYKVASIVNYNQLSNVVKMKLTDKKILKGVQNAEEVGKLLSMLGINDPAVVIMTYSKFKSGAGINHSTFKIVNDNLDTIMVLEKK
jgi:hypothetical protein